MSIIVTPLGDSQFIDLGQSFPNNWGVDVDFVTDIWGGAIPAWIPNPAAPLIESAVYRPAYEYCPPPTEPTPEPATILLVASILLLLIAYKTLAPRAAVPSH